MIEDQPGDTSAGAFTPSISPTDLSVLLREATTAARGLLRKLGLPNCEHEDLRQDLLVDLIARFKWFDPGRGTLGGFAGTITRHRARRLVNRICRERAIFVPISRDDSPSNRNEARSHDTAKADGYVGVPRQSYDACAVIERRLDLSRALRALGPSDLNLCAKLIERTPTEISRSGELSRASLYRRLRNIRRRLLAEGFSCP
jgi:DNA-directed RNA polymerase specialized sigma24 family protein